MDLIAAVTEGWALGWQGTQPVVIRADRRRFREVTGRGALIVGRRTLADFPGGRPLPGRRNIVLSRSPELEIEGAEVAHTKAEVLAAAADAEPCFVCGGASVYRQLLPYCRRAYITKIDACPPADTFLPDLDADPAWRLVSVDGEGEENGIRYRFLTYENTAPADPAPEEDAVWRP